MCTMWNLIQLTVLPILTALKTRKYVKGYPNA